MYTLADKQELQYEFYASFEHFIPKINKPFKEKYDEAFISHRLKN